MSSFSQHLRIHYPILTLGYPGECSIGIPAIQMGQWRLRARTISHGLMAEPGLESQPGFPMLAADLGYDLKERSFASRAQQAAASVVTQLATRGHPEGWNYRKAPRENAFSPLGQGALVTFQTVLHVFPKLAHNFQIQMRTGNPHPHPLLL